jgi:predicted CopG family antitoxin
MATIEIDDEVYDALQISRQYTEAELAEDLKYVE